MAPIEWPATIGSSPFDGGGLEHELKVGCERFERVVAVASGIGEPVAAVVVGDDAELVGEPLDLAVPELRRLDPAVDEDERGEVVGAVDAHVAVAAVGASDVDRAPGLGLGAADLARLVGALRVPARVERGGAGEPRCDQRFVSGRLPHSG